MKKILSIILVISMTFSLAACEKKRESTGDETLDAILSASGEQKDQAVIELYQKWIDAENNYYDLKSTLKGIQTEELPSATIGITGDGTGRFEFKSNDSKIIFGEGFGYPDAEQIAPSGSINIADKVSVDTGHNWIYKITGSALELENLSGISGTIKVSKIGQTYEAELLQSEVIAKWFEGLPPANISYSKVFVNNSEAGIQASTPTRIDSEDAYLTVGMVGFGKAAVTYIFVYRGLQDPEKDEMIREVVESIKMNNQKLKVGYN